MTAWPGIVLRDGKWYVTCSSCPPEAGPFADRPEADRWRAQHMLAEHEGELSHARQAGLRQLAFGSHRDSRRRIR